MCLRPEVADQVQGFIEWQMARPFETCKNNTYSLYALRVNYTVSLSLPDKLTWIIEMRCVSDESCLYSSELCGFPKELWPSSPNRHPHSERHSNLSYQCSL